MTTTSARPVRCRPGGGARRLALAAALLVGGSGLAGCGGSDGGGGSATTRVETTTTADPATASPPVALGPSPGCSSTAGDGAAPATGAHLPVELEVDGDTRTYQRYVPATGDDGPRPLVVDLHGYQSGAAIETQLSGLDRVADREGFVLVTPQGSGDLPYWNAVPHPDLPDDVAFVSGVLDDVGDDLCIDRSRVYVTGFSNGAFLTSLLACRLADRVAAVAPVAGLLRPADCHPSRPVPVFAVHGTADRFVSYEGGPNPALEDLTWDADSRRAFDGLAFAPVAESAAAWAEAAGCDPDADPPDQQGDVATTTYTGCDGDAEVVLVTVQGGGHTWPGSAFTAASESLLGPTTTDLDASEAIWSFFAAHPRTG